MVCQLSLTDGMEGMGNDFELRREPATLMEQKEGQQTQEARGKGERTRKRRQGSKHIGVERIKNVIMNPKTKKKLV